MSGRFDGGVRWYATGKLVIPVAFPEGDIKCRWCPMCRRDNDIRYRCQATNRILYTTEQLDENCPIQFDKEDAANEAV